MTKIRTGPSRKHQAMATVFRLLRVNKGPAAEKRKSVRRRDETWAPPHHRRRSEGPWAPPSASPTAGPHGRSARATGGRRDGRRGPWRRKHYGAARPHWSFYASLTGEGGVEVVIPIYALAPGGTAGGVVPVVADIITEHIERRGARDVAAVGDSAGAGLLMAATQELLRHHSTVPSRMVLISPWLDVTINDPRSASIDDPFGSAEGLRESARMWAGDIDPSDPLVSPIHGLQPTWVYAGTADVLFPDSLRLRERAEHEHEPFAFDLREGLIHGWAGFSFLPEAKEVAPAIMRQLTDPGVALPSPTA